MAQLKLLIEQVEKSVMRINVGTYGDHIYTYAFDTESLEFTLLEKAEAHNASYVSSMVPISMPSVKPVQSQAYIHLIVQTVW